MVELEHNNHRYMVNNGQWFRRLEVGDYSGGLVQVLDMYEGWVGTAFFGPIQSDWEGQFRVPCTDPRAPFVVGQRVKVSRKDESFPGWAADMDKRIGTEGEVAEIAENNRYRVTLGVGDRGWFFPAWCLDAVYPSPADELTAQAQELGMYDREPPT